jgi:hypothetical protein
MPHAFTRGLVIALASALVLALPASAQEPPSVVRLAGETRIETAIAISQSTFEDGAAGAVVLAREDEFADALAGAPLAARSDGGPLLVTPRNQLAPIVESEIVRVLPPGERIFLLGGEAALSTAVEDRIVELGFDAVRLQGPNRYATALAIAAEAAPAPGFITISTGNDFPDALIGGGLASAFAASVLILTDGDQLPAEVRAYLEANRDVSMTSIGPAANAALTEAASEGAFTLPFNVDGPDPATRSVVAAEAFYDRLDPIGVSIASVEAFPDALAGASHAFRTGPHPLLLTPADGLPERHVEYIQTLAAAGPSYVYGGNRAVEEVVIDQLRAALEG